MYKYYKSLLLSEGIPDFLDKYLKCPTLTRLQKVGYFCGMDYASKDIYDFKEYISRFDHSLDVALITYRFTHSKEAILAGLFHDIATPCFSHVVDYMNKDYEEQESTEELTESIIRSDCYLQKCLKEDGIDVEDIIDFKKYSIVDNNRPKLCADRLDGVILTGICWTKNIEKEDIKNIWEHTIVFTNEDNELEIGFNNTEIAEKVMEVSNSIDLFCHSNEDNFMMELLAKLTRYAIEKEYISYENLFLFDEEAVHKIFSFIEDEEFASMYKAFKLIKMDEVPKQEMPHVKRRDLNLLVNGKRIKQV